MVLDAELASDLNRRVFALNTLRAIGDYWSLGSGFGTFTLIYPSYEGKTGIFDEVVNHAHNDYLELILEGGIMFVAVLVLYALALLLKLIFGRIKNQQKVALLGIVFLLLHSLVDFPLRTMAMAVTFSFLNGLYFAPKRRPLARNTSVASSLDERK
jgi:O-antigen ligase